MTIASNSEVGGAPMVLLLTLLAKSRDNHRKKRRPYPNRKSMPAIHGPGFWRAPSKPSKPVRGRSGAGDQQVPIEFALDAGNWSFALVGTGKSTPSTCTAAPGPPPEAPALAIWFRTAIAKNPRRRSEPCLRVFDGSRPAKDWAATGAKKFTNN
jgi:hypothetical protein